uniref:Uncharacterized protein n=1 Tax=Anguilla anguilla TaxID=7936 RepID=A0A0E9WIG4_ANGAN
MIHKDCDYLHHHINHLKIFDILCLDLLDKKYLLKRLECHFGITCLSSQVTSL